MKEDTLFEVKDGILTKLKTRLEVQKERLDKKQKTEHTINKSFEV